MSLRRLFAGFRDLRSSLVSHGRSRKRTMYRVFRRILEINFSGKFRDEFGESRSFIWRTLSERQLFAITYITFNTKYELNYCSDVHQSYFKKIHLHYRLLLEMYGSQIAIYSSQLSTLYASIVDIV